MGDRRDRPILAMLLEALVATALIGTFFIYGFAGTGIGNATGPGEMASRSYSR